MIHRKCTALRGDNKKGFTLIEVIVVIVIIAILASIAVPSLTRYTDSASKRAVQATGHNIQIVLQAEKTDNFDKVFPDGDGKDLTPATNMIGEKLTYNGILEWNGVKLEEEALTDIKWGDGKKQSRDLLIGFKYHDDKWEIEYTFADGFSQPVPYSA